jgi:hypothetical protein
MRYLILFCLIILSSCVVRTGYYSTLTPINTTPIFTPNPYLYRPTWFWYQPRTYSLGNVYTNQYNHHHHNHYSPRPKTNLPLHNGPIGGRRK